MPRKSPKKTRSGKVTPTPMGATDIPSLELNPRRRYTVRNVIPEAGFTGLVTYTMLASTLLKQLKFGTPGSFQDSSTNPVGFPWRYIKFIKARAWGIPPGAGAKWTPATLVLQAEVNSYPIVLPAPIKHDLAGSASNRAFITLNGTPLTWKSFDDGGIPTTILVTGNISILDCLIEVW